jgi:hypothetical protein
LADRFVESLERTLHIAHPGHGWLEIYHRAVWTHRLSRRNGELSERKGQEDGVAIRATLTGSQAILFGAASGAGDDSVARALALAGPGEAGPVTETGRNERLIDRDGDGWLPPPADIETWLRQALDRADARSADDAWVEVATTAETWVSTGGASASRRRTRAWAMLARQCTQSGEVAPILVASRDWAGLSDADWSARPLAETAPKREGVQNVIFLRDAAAPVAQAIVATLHGTQGTSGTPVGPGWVVDDEPGDRRSLFGGSFDDCLHPTSSVRLADGERINRGVSTLGQARRASYRDRPQPFPSSLVVRPPKAETNGSEMVVQSARIHPVGPEWVIEAHPGPCWIRICPTDLAQRCLGGVGETGRSYRGVTTPGLLFADLDVRR